MGSKSLRFAGLLTGNIIPIHTSECPAFPWPPLAPLDSVSPDWRGLPLTQPVVYGIIIIQGKLGGFLKMYISNQDLYDTVYQEKIYCAKGTRYYNMVLMALGWENGNGTYLSLVRADANHKSVDEWADRYDLTPSGFIEKLKRASIKTNRKTEEEKEKEMMDKELEYYGVTKEEALN